MQTCASVCKYKNMRVSYMSPANTAVAAASKSILLGAMPILLFKLANFPQVANKLQDTCAYIPHTVS
jgi:hypothetical protein